MRACVCVKQANLVLITLYLFHQCCALAYFHGYKFTTLPSVVIDDPLILAHLWRLWARKEVSGRQRHHFTAYGGDWNFLCPQNYFCVWSWYIKRARGDVATIFVFPDEESLVQKLNLGAEQAIRRSPECFWVFYIYGSSSSSLSQCTAYLWICSPDYDKILAVVRDFRAVYWQVSFFSEDDWGAEFQAQFYSCYSDTVPDLSFAWRGSSEEIRGQ